MVVHGSSEFVYFCKRKCRAFVPRLAGLATTREMAPEHSIEHILLLNDLSTRFRSIGDVSAYKCDFFTEFDRDSVDCRANRSNSGANLFIPDAVICLSSQSDRKNLLILELDMGTMPLDNIRQKINHYIDYYKNGSYKSFDSKFQYSFSGFRLLFVLCTNRIDNILKVAADIGAMDFVWVTGISEILSRDGTGILTDKIWSVSGRGISEKFALVKEQM